MPYNPPEYAGFVEAAGYAKVKDLLAWSIDLTVPIARAHREDRRAGARAQQRGRSGRSISAPSIATWRGLQEIYRDAWQDNWGFVPPTDAEIRQLASDLRPILDPNLVLFAEIDGKPVGCAVSRSRTSTRC